MASRFTPEEVEKRKQDLSKPWVKGLIKNMSKAQVVLFKATGGRLGGKWRVGAAFKNPVPVLLLEHVGRKSGKTFTTPLVYLVDGDRLVIVGSQGGLPTDPQWVKNLKANPDCHVQLRGEKRDVRARIAEGVERADLWAKLNQLYSDFDTYQATTDRVIPVVVLDPR